MSCRVDDDRDEQAHPRQGAVGADQPLHGRRRRRQDRLRVRPGRPRREGLKVTIYLAHVDDRPKVNEVRKEYFKDNKPASTLIEISRFAIDGMLIEIEAVAVTR
jgi:Endoribonuclease L-PSP